VVAVMVGRRRAGVSSGVCGMRRRRKRKRRRRGEGSGERKRRRSLLSIIFNVTMMTG